MTACGGGITFPVIPGRAAIYGSCRSSVLASPATGEVAGDSLTEKFRSLAVF